MTIFTIGFTHKSAERFFGLLVNAGVTRVIDIRLHSTSQLAGFAKRDDLRFFLGSIGKIDYRHEPLLAPTEDLLSDYRKKRIGWDEYELRFLSLLRERQVEARLDRSLFDQVCLLCSEATPEHCHRRLIAEYLQQQWGSIEIVHLVS